MSTTAVKTETVLGRIESAHFGLGGYQGVQFGLHVSLKFDGYFTTVCKACWANRPESAKYTEAEHREEFADICQFVIDTLSKAKKAKVSELVGVPIEVEVEGQSVKEWRILEEVL